MKTCSGCGHKLGDLPLAVRQWVCPACQQDNDGDINAAINIRQQGIVHLKAEGLSVSAHGGSRKSGTSPAAACEVRSLARWGGEQSLLCP